MFITKTQSIQFKLSHLGIYHELRCILKMCYSYSLIPGTEQKYTILEFGFVSFKDLHYKLRVQKCVNEP